MLGDANLHIIYLQQLGRTAATALASTTSGEAQEDNYVTSAAINTAWGSAGATMECPVPDDGNPR